MKHGTLALMLLSVMCVGHSAQAQIRYVSQSRFVNAMRMSMAGSNCGQTVGAPEFEPFDQQVNCGEVTAEQHSTLSSNIITCQGSTVTDHQGGLLANQAQSQLQVSFVISNTMHYTLSGQLSGNLLTEIRLTGPSGVVHQGAGILTFDYCGTLAPGQYEIYSRAMSTQGSTAQHNFTLRIVKPGDVNGDESVNIDDLLGVINAWGGCANPQNCPQDITCDNAIDIDDLLAVINNWG